MSISKLEKALASPSFHKRNMRLLYLGVVFIVLGLAAHAYHVIFVVPKITNTYSAIYTKAEAITPRTETERLLRSISIEMAKQAEDGWSRALAHSAGAVTLSCVFVGGILIYTYIIRRQFKAVITRREAPNQAL